ncbi:MAG TPA: hypothetical protein VGZ28_15160 [Terriglobales bacterium]|jgi:hypothetical protein|nr:hypothetical protein [Terriglobales bacterium]
MAAKKKTKKLKQVKSKRTAGRKKTAKKKSTVKTGKSRKAPAKKKTARKRAAVKTKSRGRKATGAKTVRELRKRPRRRSQIVNTVAFPREGRGADSAGQAGDLQGLSNVEGADSESVDELLEEGNAFEADVVTGVEDAGNAEEREVHTHEVPEDDVPEEYLEKE